MATHDKPALVSGPYTSPAVKVGDAITCAIRGTVEVRGWHDRGAIGVPLGGVRGTRWSIVVSHDLLRALSVETNLAVCFYWGVSDPTVGRWRRALGIDGHRTEGFLSTMSRVGSVSGRAPGIADRLRAYNVNPWKPDELALLRTHSTPEVATRTGRTAEAVEHARSRYHLFQDRQQLQCGACGYIWLPQQNRVPKRCSNPSCRQPLG